MKKEEERTNQLKKLNNLIQTRGGSKKVAEYFINALPWSWIARAYQELGIK